MRILFALFCSLALAFAASGAQQEKKKPAPTKRAAPAAHTSRPAGKPAQVQRVTKPSNAHDDTPGTPRFKERRNRASPRRQQPGRPRSKERRNQASPRRQQPGRLRFKERPNQASPRRQQPDRPRFKERRSQASPTTTARQAQLQRATNQASPPSRRQVALR